MCNQVYVLTATNIYDEGLKRFAGESREAVEQALEASLKENWEAMCEDDRDIYNTFDGYQESWMSDIDILTVHPLPQPKPGE